MANPVVVNIDSMFNSGARFCGALPFKYLSSTDADRGGTYPYADNWTWSISDDAGLGSEVAIETFHNSGVSGGGLVKATTPYIPGTHPGGTYWYGYAYWSYPPPPHGPPDVTANLSGVVTDTAGHTAAWSAGIPFASTTDLFIDRARLPSGVIPTSGWTFQLHWTPGLTHLGTSGQSLSDPPAVGDATWFIANEPKGMTISNRGLISWTPTLGETSSGTVHVWMGCPTYCNLPIADRITFTVSTVVPNTPPHITSANPTATIVQDYWYTFQPTATDAEGLAATPWSLQNAPSGMTINSTTGLISWTPQYPVTTSGAVTLKVTDAGGLFDTQTFTLTVSHNKPAAPAHDHLIEYFTCNARGLDEPTYQWYSFTTDINTKTLMSGFTSNIAAVYEYPSGDLVDDTSYICKVSNRTGFLWSNPALFQLEFTPYFTLQPVNKNVATGTTIDLTAVAVGEPNIVTYQWYKGGYFLSDTGIYTGSQTSHLILTNPQPSDSASYWCIATNASGSKQSTIVTVTIT